MYSTKQINDNSYGDIQTLVQLCFRSNVALESIKIKYNTEMFGLRNIGFLAKSENDELAAYYGVFPAVLNYENDDHLVAQSGDTMTAPNHRKKGLFTRLAKETYTLSEKKGIKIIFGFPNENSFPGFKHKLDWKFFGCMQQFTFPVKTAPLSKLPVKFPVLRSLYYNYVKSRITKNLIEFENIDFASFNYTHAKGLIKKDRSFFEYKLKRPDTYVVDIDGFQLLIKVNLDLFIGEVSRIENYQGAQLVKTVTNLAEKLGCQKVVFSVSENHWLFQILNKILNPEKSLPIGFYIIDQSIDPSGIQFSRADYDTF